MGIFKKAKRLVKKPRKLIKKLIPKEIRPFVPYIAAAMGPAGLAQSGIFANPAVTKALIAGGAKFATDDEANLKDIGITAALAASPDLLKQGGEGIGAKFGTDAAMANQAANAKLSGSFFVPETAEIGRVAQAADKVASVASKIPTLGESGSLGTEAKLVGGLGSIDIIQDQIKLQEELLDDQGITDKSDRRKQLFDYFKKINYGSEDEINSLLDRYGYKGFAGGGIATLRPMYAEGGIMDLGGNEMDLRGGGFVPIGKKEKADDVPARLSKNEFVMTADAVRGAGGGNINVGAKRMYDMMNQYEMMA